MTIFGDFSNILDTIWRFVKQEFLSLLFFYEYELTPDHCLQNCC
jgi:hypothetical protein